MPTLYHSLYHETQLFFLFVCSFFYVLPSSDCFMRTQIFSFKECNWDRIFCKSLIKVSYFAFQWCYFFFGVRGGSGDFLHLPDMIFLRSLGFSSH